MSTRYAESLAAALVLLLTACASHTPAPSTTESSAATANLQAQPAAAPIPDDVRRAYEAAQTSMQAGDWESAERALEPIVNQHPELPGPAVNLGIVYVHLNRADDARKTLESVTQRSPGFAPAQHQLGRVLTAAGDFQAADAAYAKAVAADPNYALAYYDRAVLNELYLQRLPEALQDYEAFQRLQAKPDDQVARWIVDLRRRTGVTTPTSAAPAASGGTPAAAPTTAPPQPAKPAQPPAKGGSAK